MFHCESDGCGPSGFACDNGVCVSEDSVCDGFDTCGDNSDEEHNCGT